MIDLPKIRLGLPTEASFYAVATYDPERDEISVGYSGEMEFFGKEYLATELNIGAVGHELIHRAIVRTLSRTSFEISRKFDELCSKNWVKFHSWGILY